MLDAGAASMLTRIRRVALCSTLALGACSSTPDDLREWRAEDHPAPPAVTQDDRAAPPAPAERKAGTSQARLVAALWTARCARCHGADGAGGGPDMPPGAQMPDFTSAAFHESRTDNALARAVLQGQGMMPAFEGELSAEQIARLVGHVRGFAARSQP